MMYSRCRFATILTLLCASLASPSTAEGRREPTVFPGATGFGTRTVAGSGRHLVKPRTKIIKVTNLDDKGEGSLRECIDTEGARVCVFEVAGRMKLTKPLKVKNPYLTIAGQTAPSPGVLITGAGLSIATHDVLVQDLQILVGDAPEGPEPSERDGITIGGGEAGNIVLDHLTIGWALDENVSITDAHVKDVTVSNCIIAEGLHKSIHPKGPHSKGVMIGDNADRISIHHSLIAHNQDRNPYLKPGVAVELVNNVVYNWGGKSGSNVVNLSDYANKGYAIQLSFIGNNYIKGPDSSQETIIYGKEVPKGTRVYLRDNVAPVEKSADEWRIATIPFNLYGSKIPPLGSNVIPDDAITAYRMTLEKAGSRPKERSAFEKRIIQEVADRKGRLKDCVEGCDSPTGGWPSPTPSHRALEVPKNPFGDSDDDGYTNLEEWLHSFSEKVH